MPCGRKACIRYGIDLIGDDLRNFPLKQNSEDKMVEDCRDACVEDDQCKFFTADINRGFCLLKRDSGDKIRHHENFVSGDKISVICK